MDGTGSRSEQAAGAGGGSPRCRESSPRPARTGTGGGNRTPAVHRVGERCTAESRARFELTGTGDGAFPAENTRVAHPIAKPARTAAATLLHIDSSAFGCDARVRSELPRVGLHHDLRDEAVFHRGGPDPRVEHRRHGAPRSAGRGVSDARTGRRDRRWTRGSMTATWRMGCRSGSSRQPARGGRREAMLAWVPLMSRSSQHRPVADGPSCGRRRPARTGTWSPPLEALRPFEVRSSAYPVEGACYWGSRVFWTYHSGLAGRERWRPRETGASGTVEPDMVDVQGRGRMVMIVPSGPGGPSSDGRVAVASGFGTRLVGRGPRGGTAADRAPTLLMHGTPPDAGARGTSVTRSSA